MKEIMITTNQIQLDQFLKWANIVSSGGEAKILIQSGQVLVNGETKTRRSYKLTEGTTVELTNGEKFIIRSRS